jgi:hypothetical protein
LRRTHRERLAHAARAHAGAQNPIDVRELAVAHGIALLPVDSDHLRVHDVDDRNVLRFHEKLNVHAMQLTIGCAFARWLLARDGITDPSIDEAHALTRAILLPLRPFRMDAKRARSNVVALAQIYPQVPLIMIVQRLCDTRDAVATVIEGGRIVQRICSPHAANDVALSPAERRLIGLVKAGRAPYPSGPRTRCYAFDSDGQTIVVRPLPVPA